MVYPDALINEAVKLYRSGKSFAQIGALLGKDPEGLRVAIRRRGIELPHNRYRAHNRTEAPPDLARRYADGESVLSMSKRYGVSRNVVTRWLTEAGMKIRSGSEAGRIRMARMSANERKALASAAHEAKRGAPPTDEARKAFAETRAAKAASGEWKRSPMENQLGQWMTARGLSYIPEQVVSRYNVDFGCEPVAVELLGGAWHASPSRRAHHAKRTHDILNAGWHMVYVWSTYHVPLDVHGADKVIALVQEARRNPAPVGQYWVFRGDGKLVASGGDEGDDFALVVPSIADL